MTRRGATLVELSLAVGIALAIAAVRQALLARADRLFDSARRNIDLATGTRALVEAMLRDAASARQFLAADDGELALIRPADDEVQPTLAANPDWAFLFYDEDGSTAQKLPSSRVRYVHDPARKVVTRIEEAGVLTAQATGITLDRFDFTPRSTATRVLAGDVHTFQIRHAGRDARGALVPAGRANELPVTAASVAVLTLVARHTDGLYAPGGDRPTPEVRLTVPLWSIKRRSDHHYPESFSSTDEDLSW